MAADRDSHGSGSRSGAGYGAIESVRLRLLILTGPKLAASARAAVRALKARHTVRLFGDDPPRGIGAGIKVQLMAARLAATFRPHLIHAIGVEGAAGAAGPVAEGIKTPMILSVSPDDLSGPEGRRARRLVNRAAAVVLDDAESASRLREMEIARDLYVSAMPAPDSADEDPLFLGSIEVVYGRVVREREVDLSDAMPWEAPPAKDTDGQPLIKLGGIRNKADGDEP